MNRQSQWLFENPFVSEDGTNSCSTKGIRASQCACQHCRGKTSPLRNSYYRGSQRLFEVPIPKEEWPDYSEGSRRKATKRIDPRLIDVSDIQRGGVEPIRKPRPKPPRKVNPSLQSGNQPKLVISPSEDREKIIRSIENLFV